MIMKARPFAAKQQERQAGDFSVSVDRSGTLRHLNDPQLSRAHKCQRDSSRPAAVSSTR
jgi:hypothetical protein